jgi:hypothetical protein
MTDDESLAALPSTMPAGAATVAVFVMPMGVAVVAAVPVTVIVSELPAPAFNCTADNATFPDPEAEPQAAVPVDTQDHVTPVRLAGTVSATDAPATFDGPLFVTVSAYDTAVPRAADAGPILTMPRFATGVIDVATDEVLFVETGSVVPAGAVAVAVFVIEPAVVAVPVTLIVTEFPPPWFTCTAASEIALPDPDAPVPPTPVLQSAVPATAQLHVTPVRFAGTVSTIVAPVTLDVPVLVTTMEYVTRFP